jgi:hypothetical protein
MGLEEVARRVSRIGGEMNGSEHDLILAFSFKANSHWSVFWWGRDLPATDLVKAMYLCS